MKLVVITTLLIKLIFVSNFVTYQGSYTDSNAVNLLREIARETLEVGTNIKDIAKFNDVFGKCAELLEKSANEFSNQLKEFWNSMRDVSNKSKVFETNMITNILNAIATKSVIYENNNISCGSILKVKFTPDLAKLNIIISQGSFFGGLVDQSKVGDKKIFITSMFSTHRDLIKKLLKN